MTVYDLSVPTVHGADWYREPGCIPVRLRDVGSLAREGWLSHELSLMVLNGCTYLEAAGHVIEGGMTLDDLPPERLITRAFVLGPPREGRLLRAPPHDLVGFRAGEDALLLHCGWDTHLHAPDYYQASPYFAEDLQAWILRHRPAILGSDVLSFDDPAGQSMPFVNAFFRQGGLILCPLVGLSRLPTIVTLCAAPLRLQGANAAPCRALAW
ncbi:MAG: cyclase family protein [Armatimonadota bacterium]